MDKDSVAAHLIISPTIAGHLRWPTTQRFVYTPSRDWEEGVGYQATLTSGATDVHGVPMGNTFQVRFGRMGRGVPIPVLMYHHILKLDEEATEGQRTWTVSPDAFAAQMAYLQGHGWRSISPTQLATYLTAGQPLPPKPIIISMDDGYKEVFTSAYPILIETELRPVLFIVPQYVGYGAYMDWSQLEELVSAGFIIGSHGYDHSNLRQADEAELQHQVDDSRTVLAERLGVTIDAFCYPFGSYDERTLAALEEHHYTSAFTLNPTFRQYPGDSYRLNRLRVTYDMTIEEFTQLLP